MPPAMNHCKENRFPIPTGSNFGQSLVRKNRLKAHI